MHLEHFVALNPWRKNEIISVFEGKCVYFVVHGSIFVEIRGIEEQSGLEVIELA
jgi:hypothetical protein